MRRPERPTWLVRGSQFQTAIDHERSVDHEKTEIIEDCGGHFVVEASPNSLWVQITWEWCVSALSLRRTMHQIILNCLKLVEQTAREDNPGMIPQPGQSTHTNRNKRYPMYIMMKVVFPYLHILLFYQQRIFKNQLYTFFNRLVSNTFLISCWLRAR